MVLARYPPNGTGCWNLARQLQVYQTIGEGRHLEIYIQKRNSLRIFTMFRVCVRVYVTVLYVWVCVVCVMYLLYVQCLLYTREKQGREGDRVPTVAYRVQDHASWSVCVRISRVTQVSVVDVRHIFMPKTIFVGPPNSVYKIEHVTLWCVRLLFIPPRVSKQPDTFHSKIGFLLRRNVAGNNKIFLGLHCKVPDIFLGFNQTWILSISFHTSLNVYSTAICPVGAVVIYAERWTDGLT